MLLRWPLHIETRTRQGFSIVDVISALRGISKHIVALVSGFWLAVPDQASETTLRGSECFTQRIRPHPKNASQLGSGERQGQR